MSIGCYEDEGLQVHHLTYIRLGNERPSDLIVLCGYHYKAYGVRYGHVPSEEMDFYEWITANFGGEWRSKLSEMEAKEMYRAFLVSEWPLDRDW